MPIVYTLCTDTDDLIALGVQAYLSKTLCSKLVHLGHFWFPQIYYHLFVLWIWLQFRDIYDATWTNILLSHWASETGALYPYQVSVKPLFLKQYVIIQPLHVSMAEHDLIHNRVLSDRSEVLLTWMCYYFRTALWGKLLHPSWLVCLSSSKWSTTKTCKYYVWKCHLARRYLDFGNTRRPIINKRNSSLKEMTWVRGIDAGPPVARLRYGFNKGGTVDLVGLYLWWLLVVLLAG